MGMLMPAKFGALSAEGPFLVSFQPGVGGMTRDKILFAAHVWDPETVNDIVRDKLQPNGSSDGDVNLVRGNHKFAWLLRILVVHLPPPLMADHFEAERIWIRGERVNGAAGEDVDEEEGKKNEDSGDDTGDDHCRKAPLRAGGRFLGR